MSENGEYIAHNNGERLYKRQRVLNMEKGEPSRTSVLNQVFHTPRYNIILVPALARCAHLLLK